MTVEEQEDLIKEKYGERDVLIQKYRRLTYKEEENQKESKQEISKLSNDYTICRLFRRKSISFPIVTDGHC